MNEGTNRSYLKPREFTVCLVAVLLCPIAHAQQPQSRCSEERTKPLLEVALDKHLQEADPIRVRDAIQELGQRRCVEIIDDLVSLLAFRFPFPKDASEPGAGLQPIFTGTRFPATGALFQIGRPALPPLIRVIESEKFDSLLSKNARYTVRSIFRWKRDAADEFFKESAKRASLPEAKQRLLKALETSDEDFKSD